MSNQSNYAHKSFGKISREVSKIKKKLIKSLMFMIMVSNMASILTQVYMAKVTPIYNFFPHLLHTLPFISLSLL